MRARFFFRRAYTGCYALTALPAAFAPLWGPTPVLVMAGLMVLVVVVQVARSPRLAQDAPRDWRGGLFYADAEDPRLVVPKRSGIGWTFNYARRAAWVVTALLLLGPLAIVAAMMLRAAGRP